MKKLLVLFVLFSLILLVFPACTPVQPVPTPEAAEETVTPEAAEETVTPEAAEETVTPEAAEETVTPEAAEETVTPEAAEETVTPEAAEETVTPEVAEETATPEEAGTEPMDIRDYVRQIFVEGVPYEETLNNYDSSVVPILLEMLNDPAEEPFWANIVVVLTIVGDERVVDPLIEFIERGEEGELSEAYYRARTSAVMSMGYLINRTGNEEALNYLIDSLQPEVWEERGTTGVAPFQASVVESHLDLSKFAILGLALSGHPLAAETLRMFAEPVVTEEGQAFQAQVSDLVSEALETNERIAEEGLIEYYEEPGS